MFRVASLFLAMLLLVSSAVAYAEALPYACANGWLYKPNGSRDDIGANCDPVKVGVGYACWNGWLYKPDNSRDDVGPSCDAVKIGVGFAGVKLAGM